MDITCDENENHIEEPNTSSDDESEPDEDEDEDVNSVNINRDYDERENSYNFNDEDRLIQQSIQCSRADALLMIEAYRIRHNPNWRALNDLLLLINNILGVNLLPKSSYLYRKKICFKTNIKRTIHFQCTKCNVYLGTKEELEQSDQTHCHVCQENVTTKTKYKKNFFITLPIELQIRKMIQENIEHVDLSDSQSTDYVKDFRDGDIYKEIKQKLNGSDFVSITFNTDGGQVFKKSKDSSFWPIQFFINEFSKNIRFKRNMIMCAGFSYGSTPDMSTFLKPFIEEVNKINEGGGISIRMSDESVRRFLIVPLHCTVDSVAKCHVLNSIQFNGRFGCPICEIEGDSSTGGIRYCNSAQEVPLRENLESRDCMRIASETNKIVKGYKGLCVFLAIQVICFNVVWQVVIDKMHSVDLGVTKKLLNLWLDGISKEM